jgi:hypothetical protein
MGRNNTSINYVAWLVLITFVGISCYFIVVNAYRDVMPMPNGIWIAFTVIGLGEHGNFM